MRRSFLRFGGASLLATALFGGSSWLLYESVKVGGDKKDEQTDVKSPVPVEGRVQHVFRSKYNAGCAAPQVREEGLSKTQEELYAGLYNVFLECMEKEDYSKFVHDLSQTQKKVLYFGVARISWEEIYAYLNKDEGFLCEQALVKGKFLDAAMLSAEFDVPEEVVRELYEKGREFKDGVGHVYWDLPYSRENFDLQRFSFLRNYLHSVLRMSSPQEGGYPTKIRERFLEFFGEYPETMSLRETESMVKIYGVDAYHHPQMRQEVMRRIPSLQLDLEENKKFDTLEELVSGYNILSDEWSLRQALSYFLPSVFEDEYQRRVVDEGIERDGASYLFFIDKLERMKPYVDDVLYQSLREKTEALREL